MSLSPEFAHQAVGSVGATFETITLPDPLQDILIVCTHATQKLWLLCKKSSTEWNADTAATPIAANYGSISVRVSAHQIKLKGDGADTGYAIYATKK